MFTTFARTTERAVGSPWAFVLAAASVVLWASTGPLFGFSDTWQMVINTATTIVTFLIVFLIQATQTQDTAAIHIKLDELLRAVEGARTSLVVAEDLDRAELDRLRDELHDAASIEASFDLKQED